MGWGLITLLLLNIVSASEGLKWDLNDVSVLFALPAPEELQTLLLKPDAVGKKGPLIPESIYKLNSYLLPEDYNPMDTYKDLRAVGIRIDPCFKMQESGRCERQIRIVWQPVVYNEDGVSLTTRDAAVHTFYVINENEWKSLLITLQKIKFESKNLSNGKALGVHPALLNKKTRATFQAQMNALITRYCGEKAIVRFTFMRLVQKDFWWVFGGFDRVSENFDPTQGKNWAPIKIPRITMIEGDPIQNFTNEENVPTVRGMRGFVVFSAKDKKQTLDQVLNLGHAPGEWKEDRVLFEEKLALISQIEDPRKANPNTMDCVHCHIAEPVKHFLNHQSLNLKQPRSFLQEMNLSKRYNVKNSSKNLENSRALRSFGYFGADPHVNQRVINESVDVAEQLNQL